MRFGILLYKFGTVEDFGTHLGSFQYVVKKLQTLEQNGADFVIIAPWVSFWKKGSTHLGRVPIVRYWPPLFNNFKYFPFDRLLTRLYIWQTQRVVLRSIKKFDLKALYVRQARETGFAIAQIKSRLSIPFIFRQITAWEWHFNRTVKEVFAKNSLYKRLEKLPFIWLIDQILFFVMGRKNQIHYAKMIYQNADMLVFSTHGAAVEGKNLGLDMSKVQLLPEAVEEHIFTPYEQRLKTRRHLGLASVPTVLFVGRINVAEKGIDYLISACSQVRKVIPDVQLVIVGGGAPDQIKQLNDLIYQVHGEEFVKYVGKKPFAEVSHYINAADVVCVPSVWMEAFGRITVEAMSCGVPVITSDTGGSPEVNIHGFTGLVVPARDAQALAQGIITVLKDPQKARQMGLAGRQRVLENYTYPRIQERFLRLVEGGVKGYNTK